MTTASTAPKRWITRGSRARTWASSSRSAWKDSTSAPAPARLRQSSTVFAASSAEPRKCTATCQPPAASASATSRPSRLAEPVTSTVRLRGESLIRGQSWGDHRSKEFNESLAGPGGRIDSPRRGLAALRPLHGAGAVRAGPGLLRQRIRASSAQLPSSGSDFVTAPEMTPLFGQALAVQVEDALRATGTSEIWEFGAGSGALAAQLLGALGTSIARYTIVDLSGTLRERQREALAGYGDKVRWVSELPEQIQRRGGGQRSAGRDAGQAARRARTVTGTSAASDRRPRVGWTGQLICGRRSRSRAHTTTSPKSIPRPKPSSARWPTAWSRERRSSSTTVSPKHEYYHPQRHMGTLMCHRGHLADTDPLADLGAKDITAHVNFTGIALAAQEAGLRRAWLHQPGALPDQLRPCRHAGAGIPARTDRRPAPAGRTRDGRAVQGHRLAQRAPSGTPRGFPRETGRIGFDLRPLVLICALLSVFARLRT